MRTSEENAPALEHLLVAATEGFAKHGFAGVGTRQIAALAGRSPAALYIHYKSKEELLRAVVVRGHENALQCLSTAYAVSDDPAVRLHAMVLEFSLWHLRNSPLARVSNFELLALSSAGRGEVRALQQEVHAIMASAVSAGVANDHFAVADVNGTAAVLLSVCVDLVRRFDGLETPNQRAVAILNADLALRMVGA